MPWSIKPGTLPKASRPISPEGRDGLSLDSITSAINRKASVYKPGISCRLTVSQPNKIDSPKRRLLIRPTSLLF